MKKYFLSILLPIFLFCGLSASAVTLIPVRQGGTGNSSFTSGYMITGNGTGSLSVTNPANWNTAYGWGDHATQGYFDKDTETLDDIPDGTTYKLLTAAKDGYINQDVTNGSSPTFLSPSISGIVWGGETFATSSEILDLWDLGNIGNVNTSGVANGNVLNYQNGWMSTSALTILPNGNVGIGTATPLYALEVNGAIQTNTAFRGDYWISSTGNSMAIQPTGDTDDYFSFKTPAHRPTIKREGGKYIYIESSNVNDVGLSFRKDDDHSGTLNYYKDENLFGITSKDPFVLKVCADYENYIQFCNEGAIPRIYVASSSGLKVDAGGTNPLMLNSTGGNVGIGTTSPTHLFEVAGNGYFEETLKVGAYTLPNTDGTDGYVLKTNGSGVLSWQVDTSGTGGGAGLWATSSDSLLIYPIDINDVVVVGGNATTSTGHIFEVIGDSEFDTANFSGAITASNLNVSNWDTAHGWGDHLGLYDILGQATSTLASHTNTYNHANYDTAFGWGNHSGLYDILGQATSTLASHTATYNHANYDTAYSWGDWNTNIDISTDTNLTVGAVGIELSDDDIALTANYIIPLSASTTAWENFYNTPSGRISAGTGLSWSTNTINWSSSGLSWAGNAITNAYIASSTEFLASEWTDGGLFIYPTETSDTVVIGGSATTSTGHILEIIGDSEFDTANFSGAVTVATGDNPGLTVGNGTTGFFYLGDALLKKELNNFFSFANDGVQGIKFLTIGQDSPATDKSVYIQNAIGDSNVIVTIRKRTNQTGDMTVWEDTNGVDLIVIDASGNIDIENTATTTNLEVITSSKLGTIVAGVWNGTDIDISDYTNLEAGTNITLTDDTLNVDDAFLVNNASDIMAGTLTADGLTLGANENVTLGSKTLDHDGTEFKFNDSINSTGTSSAAFLDINDCTHGMRVVPGTSTTTIEFY